MTSAFARITLACACALALTGCISLFPKSKPVYLYRFGQTAAATEAAPAAAAGRVGVFRANGTFQAEAAGDRMLTVTGQEAAYIAESRWVAPASVLFDAAVLRAFDNDPGRTRLISRGEPADTDYLLRLDMRNFETRYEAGPELPPTVVVRLRAAMTRGGAQSLVADRIFEAKVVAGDNRVSAIAAAYDRAVMDILGELVGWTNSQARPVG